MTGFVLADVLTQLRSEGVTNANPRRVNYLIQMGKLSRPQLDGAHRFIFEQAHIDRLRVLLAEMPSARRIPLIT